MGHFAWFRGPPGVWVTRVMVKTGGRNVVQQAPSCQLVNHRLWDPTAQIDRSAYPRMGEVMFDHGRCTDVSREHMTKNALDDYDNNVYPSD